MKDPDPIGTDELVLAKKPKRKRAKLGILGVPRTNRTLFMVSQSLDSDEDEGEEADPDFTLSSDEETKKPTKKRKSSLKPPRQKKTPKKEECTVAACSVDGGWSSGIPYEILLKIFKYYMLNARGNILELEKLREVCQTWNSVANDPKLLFNVDFSLHSALKTPRGPGTLKRISSKLDFYFTESLDLSGIPIVYENLEAILKKCNPDNLAQLSISSCQKLYKSTQGKSYLRLIADRFQKLNTLKLAAQNRPFGVEEFAYLMAKVGSSLRSLDLSHNTITMANLKDVADHCPNLECIELAYCEFKYAKNIKIDFDYLGEKCAKLREMNMIRSSPRTKFVSAEAVVLGQPCFSNLERLNMAFVTTVQGTDQMIWLMARLCRDSELLKVLDIQTYKSPLDSNINIFSFVKSTRLRRLHLCNSTLSEADNYYLAHEIEYRWLGSLVEIDFSWSNVRPDTLRKILECFMRYADHCSLEILNLTGTSIEQETLKQTLPGIRTIKQLNLSSCRSIDRSYKRLLDSIDIGKLVATSD